MKIILFSRQGVVHTAGDLHQMFDAIARFGFDYAVNEEFAPQIERLTGISIDAAHRYGRPMGPQPAESVLVCYGGDGTLLDGIHRLGGAEIPVIGINSGHLGFLTSVPRNGCIGDVFELIAAGKLECQPRSMLEVTGDFGDGISTRYAVNEVVIQRQGAGMISVETYVNDQMVATAHAERIGRRAPQPDDAPGRDSFVERRAAQGTRPARRNIDRHRQRNLSDSRRSRIQGPTGFQTLFSGGPAQYIVLRHVTQENDVGSGYPKLTKNPCLPEILSLSDFIPYICML